MSLSLVARKAGYRVSVARDAREALERIAQVEGGADRIDVLVIDIQMPGMSGLELCEQLQEGGRSLPVILISGYRYREVISSLHPGGVTSYLEKPFLPEEFLAHVDRADRSLQVDEAQFKGGTQ